jgi:transcriptional regulator with XRE-family HTH domain
MRDFGLANFKSLKEFAIALGMRPQNIQKYIYDGRAPGAEILIRLSELGCSIDWLLTGNDASKNMAKAQNARMQELEAENQALRNGISELTRQVNGVTKVAENLKLKSRHKT